MKLINSKAEVKTDSINEAPGDWSGLYNQRFEIYRSLKHSQEDLSDDPGNKKLIEDVKFLNRLVELIEIHQRNLFSSIEQSDVDEIRNIYVLIQKKQKLPAIGHELERKMQVIIDATLDGEKLPNVKSREIVEIPKSKDEFEFQTFPNDKAPNSIFKNPQASSIDIMDMIDHITTVYAEDELRVKRIQEQIKLKSPDPTKADPIVEKNDCLYKMKYLKNRDPESQRLTSFLIRPKFSIDVPDEGEYLKADLITKKAKEDVLFKPDAWLSNQRFLKYLNSSQYTFVGSSPDVQLIRGHLSRFNIHRKVGVKRTGIYKGVFLTENGNYGIGVYNERGDFVTNFEFVGDKVSSCEITKSRCPDRNVDFRLIGKFNTPKVVLPVLGWITACFYKRFIMDQLKGFPTLIIEGEAGAGKTRTLEDILMRIWSIKNGSHSLGEQTKFSIMKLVDSSNCIPVFFEENKSSMQDDQQKTVISNLIRSSYNELEGQRGRADQTLEKYCYKAPCAIAGETGFSESALLDRTICVRMSKKDSKPYEQNFLALKGLPLEGIGKLLLQSSVISSYSGYKIPYLNKELQAVSPRLKDRPRYNAAICRFGLRILEETINDNTRLKYKINFSNDLHHVDQVVLEGITDNGKERKSAVDKILESMFLMSSYIINPLNDSINYDYSDHLKELVHYQIDDTFIRLWVAGAYPIFNKWARTYGFEGDLLPENTFKTQLKKENYFVKTDSVKVGMQTKRCFILDLKKMQYKGLDICNDWLEEV